jgi:hypothetical protein
MPVPQPARHRQQLCGRRGVAAQLLHPPAGPLRVRHPHTRLQTSLAQIQRRHPLHHQIGVVDFITRILPGKPITTRRSPAGTEQGWKESDPRVVLVATMRSPTIGSPNQTQKRAHCAKKHRPRRATAPDFPACAGVPKEPRNSKFVAKSHATWRMMADSPCRRDTASVDRNVGVVGALWSAGGRLGASLPGVVVLSLSRTMR